MALEVAATGTEVATVVGKARAVPELRRVVRVRHLADMAVAREEVATVVGMEECHHQRGGARVPRSPRSAGARSCGACIVDTFLRHTHETRHVHAERRGGSLL